MKRVIKKSFLIISIFAIFSTLLFSQEQKRRKVSVAYFNIDRFQEGQKVDSVKSGYAYDYYQRIADFSGWEYEYVYGTNEELYKKFLEGKIDLFAGLTYSEEREKYMVWPDYKLDTVSHSFLVLKDSDIVWKGKETINGKTIGCINYTNNTRDYENWKKLNGLSATTIYFDTIEESFNALYSHEVDIIVGVDNYIQKNPNLKILFTFDKTDSYICVRKDALDILNELNNALFLIHDKDPEYEQSLKEKYYGFSPYYNEISKADFRLLEEKEVLKVGFIDDYLPYCKKSDNGVVGVLDDIFKALKSITEVDLKVDFIPFAELGDVAEALNKGEIDLGYPIPNNRWYAEQTGIMTSADLYSVPMTVIFQGDYSEDKFNSIAITSRTIQKLYTSLHYPKSQIIEVADAHECLDSIKKGLVDCSIFTSFRVAPYLKKSVYSNLNSLPLRSTLTYCFGVTKGNTELLNILNTAISYIDTIRLIDALYQYVDYEHKYTFIDLIAENLASFFLFLFIFLTIIGIAITLYLFGINSAQKETRMQMVISEALSRDYPFAVLIDDEGDFTVTVKKDGKMVPRKEFKKNMNYTHLWEVFAGKYIKKEDRRQVLHDVDLEIVSNALKDSDVYDCIYQCDINGEIHTVQTTFIKLQGHKIQKYLIIAGFRYIDSLVEKEKKQNDIIKNALQREKEAAKALREAKIHADDASRAKSAFLFNMSHDIRTPMNAILGFSTLAGKHLNEPELISKYLSNINVAGDKLLSIINNVLNLARIEKGKTVIEEKPENIEAAFNSYMTIFQEDVRKKNITFNTSCNFYEKNIYLDSAHYGDILLNIISNAIKYTPENGTVTCNAKQLKGESSDMCVLEFEVSDNGIGMSEEFQKHIFEEFERDRNSTTSGIQGTGLGMGIAKKLIDLMNGTIEVHSELNVGSKFVIRTPHRIAEEAACNTKDNLLTEKRFDGKRILLAEDNELNSEIARELLKDFGFEVDWADGGASCISKLEEADDDYYNLILMDIQMPLVDGYTATKIIRSMDNQKKRELPIIAMTANAFDEDKQNAMKAGMNGHISKPINVHDMIQVISDVLKE